MATTAIAVERLTIDTISTDFATVGGGSGNNLVATTPSDGWVISPATNSTPTLNTEGVLGEKIILRLVADGTGDTVTVTAGDRYPAHRIDLGALTLTLAASDVRYVVLESSRYLQDDGTIIVTATDAGTALTAMELPFSG